MAFHFFPLQVVHRWVGSAVHLTVGLVLSPFPQQEQAVRLTAVWVLSDLYAFHRPTGSKEGVDDVIDVATQADMDGIAVGVQTDILSHQQLDLFNSHYGPGLLFYDFTLLLYSILTPAIITLQLGTFAKCRCRQ